VRRFKKGARVIAIRANPLLFSRSFVLLDQNRWFEIDLVKAVSILGVIYIHSISRVMVVTDPIGLFFGDWTRFAVPGFVFAAGFLFKKGAVDTPRLAWRLLTRIIPPYLVCSLVILWLGMAERGAGAGVPTGVRIAIDLAFGNTVGIYYFVFVISYLYAFSFLLRLFSPGAILGIWAVTAGVTIWFYLEPLRFIPAFLKQVLPREYYELYFVLLRHPCVHLLFYLSGWVVNQHYDRIQPALRKNFAPIVLTAAAADIVALYVIHRSHGDFSLKQLTIQVHIFLTLLCVLLVGIKGRPGARAVDYLSRNSYAIFLVHLPFVRLIQGWFPAITVRYSLVYSNLAWLGGIIGSILVIAMVKLIFRKFSPYIVGA
jgi:surface polysaccharide O-acyltransferase-like enzyme